jgi:hypothetical protein
MDIYEIQQNFLLSELDNLVINRKKGASFRNLITINDIPPNDFINKLNKLPNNVYEAYHELTPLQKSFLYPNISLFRKDKNNQYRKIMSNTKFDSKMMDLYVSNGSPSEIFNTSKEISGVGIERIVITNNPERDSDVNIKVSIDLYIENILYLMHQDIRDLITVPIDKNDVNGVDHRIKLTYGWGIPEDYTNDRVITKELKEALKYSYQTILCELYRHDLTFNENGSIGLKIEYIGGLDGFIKSKQADLMNPENYINKNISQLPKFKENVEKIQKLREENKTDQDDPSVSEKERFDKNNEEISKLEEENVKFKTLLLTPLYGKILLDLNSKGLIKYLSFNALEVFKKRLESLVPNQSINKNIYSDLKYKIITSDVYSKPKDIAFSGGEEIGGTTVNYESVEIPKDEMNVRPYENFEQSSERTIKRVANLTQEELNEGKLEEISEQTENDKDSLKKYSTEKSQLFQKGSEIYYFFLGDLLDIIIENFEFSSDEFRFIFGTFDYINYTTNKSSYKNFADLPINLYTFLVWWNNYVISSRPNSYPFNTFIKDLFKDLVSRFFGNFGNTDNRTPMSMYSVNFNILNSGSDLKNGSYGPKQIESYFINKYDLHLNASYKTYQYMLITARSRYNEDLRADFHQDVSRGIYHYRIAQTKGIIENISFSKVDNQKLYDARMVNQSLNTAGEILKEHYNAQINCIGNPCFENGKYFYLDPSYNGLKIGKQITQTIGLGGYYFCLGFEHILTNGSWQTSIKGIFHSVPGAEANLLPFNKFNNKQEEKKTPEQDPSVKQ